MAGYGEYGPNFGDFGATPRNGGSYYPPPSGFEGTSSEQSLEYSRESVYEDEPPRQPPHHHHQYTQVSSPTMWGFGAWMPGWWFWGALLGLALLGMTIAILVLEVEEDDTLPPLPPPGPRPRPCDPENLAFGGPCPEIPMCCTSNGCDLMPDWAIGCRADIIVVGCGSAALAYIQQITNYVSPQGKRYTILCIEEGEINNLDPIVYKAWEDGVPYWLFPNMYSKYTTSIQYNPPTPLGVIGSNGRGFSGTSGHDYAIQVYPSPELMSLIDNNLGGGTPWTYSRVTSALRSQETFHGSTDCLRGYSGSTNVEQYNYTGSTSNFMYQMMNLTALNSPSLIDQIQAIEALDYNCPYAELFWSVEYEVFWKKISPTYYQRSFPGVDMFGPTEMDQTTGIGVSPNHFRAITGALVNKVDINSTGHAYRVNTFVNGRNFYFYADRVINIAAGSIYTPGILERSGIGDPSILSPLGIPVVVSNPAVGADLQTHCGSLFIVSTNATLDSIGFSLGTGQLGLAMLPEMGNLRSVQILELDPATGVGFLGSAVLADYILGNMGVLPPGWHYVAFLVNVIHPASKGSVHINSAQPSVPPAVVEGAFTDGASQDLRLNIAAMQSLYAALNTFIATNPFPYDQYDLLYPPPAVMGNVTLLGKAIVDYPLCQDHYSSTAAMGPVLDNNLNVKGVKNLAVIDCSAWPYINNGNTRTQALATGAVGAEIFLSTHSI